MFSADLGVTPSAGTLYTDDVFSTFLYTGSGSALTINNGIDLAGKGGMVWVKNRSSAAASVTMDSARGPAYWLYPALTNAQSVDQGSSFSAGGGFAFATAATVTNANGASYASWTFRKAPKFFDVVTWTGDGTTTRAISHSLGIEPGIIIVKETSSTDSWLVWNRTQSVLTDTLFLNLTDAYFTLNSTAWGGNNGTPPSATNFTIGSNNALNQSGQSYVAYLFAHDTTSTGLIQCGSFTTDASGNASVTTLGWEPQFLMVKASSTTGDWIMLDTMRGWNMTTSDALLRANLSNAETTSTEYGNPTATGFDFKGGAASATYVYMAIRRPNKPPTSGSGVFALNTATANGSAVAGAVNLTGQSNSGASRVDLALLAARTGTVYFLFADRLRGMQSSSSSSSSSYNTGVLDTASTAAETSTSIVYQRTGLENFEDFVSYYSATNLSRVGYAFKRAPGFFDVVCYTGTGASRTVAHNLGVKPDLLIVKRRDAVSVDGWSTTAFSLYGSAAGAWKYHWLNTSNGNAFADATIFPDTEPTSSAFSLGSYSDVNASGGTYVAYLFASLPGISKIGTYTGNGTTQTINCGFAAGARFVLIKRTDAAGDWYVWDTARGIVAATDPHLSLNSTAAEVTTDDSVDPVSSGFAVNQLAATNINVSSATYLYFAIA